MSRVRQDHPRCCSAMWICVCGHAPDIVIYSKFHRNPFRGFGAPGGRNLPIPITLFAARSPWCSALLHCAGLLATAYPCCICYFVNFTAIVAVVIVLCFRHATLETVEFAPQKHFTLARSYASTLCKNVLMDVSRNPVMIVAAVHCSKWK